MVFLRVLTVFHGSLRFSGEQVAVFVSICFLCDALRVSRGRTEDVRRFEGFS